MSKLYPCVYYERVEGEMVGRCRYYSKDGILSWCTEGAYDCEHETPSNADRIRAMTDEELAEYIHAVSLGWQDWCDYHCENKGDDGCDNCILALLKQPVKDGENDG